MLNNISASALAVSHGIGIPQAKDPGKIHAAAQQFESLLIGQLLKTAHEGGSGWLGTDDDDAGQTGIGFGEEQFAKMMSASGGIGLASLIESGLKAEAAKGSGNVSD